MRHVKRGYPETDSNTEDESPPTKKYRGEVDDSDDPAFETFINDAYDQYDNQYQEKVDQFLKEGLLRAKYSATGNS